MPQPTVLITGAAGFIGSHLTEHLLTAGCRVVGLDNFCDFYNPQVKRRNLQAAMTHDRFTLIEADIRDRQAVFDAFDTSRPDQVIHLAAMAGVRPSIEQPDYYTAVNITGTVNMLDAAVAHGAKRLVFASSSSVYGNNEKAPFAEDDRVDHPISPYAATKKAGELLCHTYWHLHRLPIACLRLFTVFGPRQRPDLAISKFLNLIAGNQPITMFGDGSTSRDYTYVQDIVAGICAAMDRCKSFNVYNLGGSHPISLKDLIATIESVTGQTAQIKQLPMQLGDVNRTWADLTLSKTDLGYEPKTSVADGITKQWQWVQSISPTG